jgi:CHAD domain-containing protein
VLRRLAQSLGRARDAVALRETLERLLTAAPADVRARLSDHVPELERVLVDTSETPKEVDSALAVVHDGLGALRSRAREWTVQRRGFAVIAPGLRRTYTSGRKALGRALHRPSERRLHRFRTWVKRHQYQLTLLEPLWPEPIKAFRHEAQRLGELLGHDHDLHLLESRFERLAASPALAPLESMLRTVAETSHAALQREAFDLAARLYAEPPARFTARHREYFDAWL